jgi:indole-3-glycerol phosphate synthase
MILDRILEEKRRLAADRSGGATLAQARSRASDAGPTRGFRAALGSAPSGLGLIAEVKRSSPARASAWPHVEPARYARVYEAEGAQALSVLTDARWFRGSPEDLAEARGACSLPVLRKDFTVCELDVWEARAMGADAVLLIVRGLEPGELRAFRELAEELSMDALVEVHTEYELATALASGAKIVGVNNRDLATFETTLEPSLRLLPTVPDGVLKVSESALDSEDAVRSVHRQGADAVLIGSFFCESPDPAPRIREVAGWR